MLAALAVCSAAFGPWGSAPRARAEARCAATMSAPLAELRTKEELRSGIAGFYDKSSGIWERVWGEHMHHGYYPGGAKKDHRQAQVDMIDEVLAWSGAADRARAQPASRPLRILDVGCGIGGSTRHIAREYGMVGEGITLSPVQAERANALTARQGLSDALVFSVADALQMPYADDSFDLVWSLESGEHMPDREKFVSELARVLKPGGDLIVVAWCHRDLRPDEDALQPRESRRVAPLAIRDAPASLIAAAADAGCPVRLALIAVIRRAQTAPAHLARVLPARVVVRRRLRTPRESLGPARHSHGRLDRRRRAVLASGHFERLSPAQSARPPALGALDAAWRARHAAHDTRLPQGRHQVRADPRVKAGAIAAPAAARRNVAFM